MSSSPPVTRGVHELRRLLREQMFDLRTLEPAGFRGWLDDHLARWQNDPVFVQRVRIRDLRRAHPELCALEEQYCRAASADAATPQFTRLGQLEQERIDNDKAVSGLTAALARAAPERRSGLQAKLGDFRARGEALREEQARLIQSSPQRQELLRIDAELRQLRAVIGLDREEERLEKLLKQQGRRSGRSGESFEQLALELTRSCIVPELLRGSEAARRRVRVLRGVTLGAARTELDQLVVRQPPGGARPAEVLALVEAKRNINDLAHGFRRRKENLAWLTGDAERYDPALYRTNYFRTGHFDREAVHAEGGETYRFARSSFRRFRRDGDTGLVLGRLYFITRAGPLWGVSAAALGRISYRVATDQDWDPDSEDYLRKLLGWCRSLAEPFETPDVLRAYASTPGWARKVLLVGRYGAGLFSGRAAPAAGSDRGPVRRSFVLRGPRAGTR